MATEILNSGFPNLSELFSAAENAGCAIQECLRGLKHVIRKGSTSQVLVCRLPSTSIIMEGIE